MRRRRIVVQLEIDTDAPMGVLRKAKEWRVSLGCGEYSGTVIQAQVNAIRTEKETSA